MNNFRIKTILYLLTLLVSVLSIIYIFINYQYIKKSTLKSLNTESINRAYKVTKQLSALNDKMAWEYNKYNNALIESLKYTQDYFAKYGKNASLEKLKAQLDSTSDSVFYHVYIIDNDYVIRNTTFTPDMNLDFHIIPEALKVLQKAYNNPKYIDISSATNDAVTNDYKKYILQKAKNKEFLIQLSLSIKNEKNINTFMNDIHKNIPNLLSTNVYLIFLKDETRLNIDIYDSKNYKKGTKSHNLIKQNLFNSFKTMAKTDKTIDMKDFKKYIVKFSKNEGYKDTYFYRDSKYIHQIIMPFYSYLNNQEDTVYIISIEFDESEAREIIQNMEIIAYIIWVVFFIIIFLLFYIIKLRVIKPIENFQSLMKNKKPVDSKLLINTNDEISSMSLIYNQLLKDLKREITSNEELLEEFKNFTANTIHQVRTPVSVIKIALEMIETTNDDAVLQIKASLISIEHMYDSLSYALHHEHVKFTKEKLNLSELLKQRVKLFSTIAKAYDLDIQSSLEKDLYININQTEAEYLIDNNLSNAIKYGTPQKEIIVKLHKIALDINLSFESYGDKIQDTEIIFERFHRINKDRQGNGIGLHMVDNICKNNNILIQVDYLDGKNQFNYFFNEDVT